MLTRRHFVAAGAAAAFGVSPAFAHKAYVVPEAHKPRFVDLPFILPEGEIHVEPDEFALYLTVPPIKQPRKQISTKAIRYTVGIGRGKLYHSGVYTVGEKREWPNWKPTPEMIRRNPNYSRYADGVPGGPTNPLGAMALYLFNSLGRDTMLRIHGTPQPWTVGQAVSNGCARLVNSHAVDLYNQVELNTRVILHEKGRMIEGQTPDLLAIPGFSTHS